MNMWIVHHGRVFVAVTALSCLPFIFYTPDARAQAKEVQTLVIKSVWKGLGPYSEATLTIRRARDGFYRDGRRGKEALIENLLQETRAEADAPALRNLGITGIWLRDTADRV
ncbi:MAG TPA: hypothetical protein VK388_05380 [Pyrinomonadaceae bacterium]|nr:hypothetical protein [Pyrinomonadaceae bacterium]